MGEGGSDLKNQMMYSTFRFAFYTNISHKWHIKWSSPVLHTSRLVCCCNHLVSFFPSCHDVFPTCPAVMLHTVRPKTWRLPGVAYDLRSMICIALRPGVEWCPEITLQQVGMCFQTETVYLFIWGFTSLSTLYRWYHDGQLEGQRKPVHTVRQGSVL